MSTSVYVITKRLNLKSTETQVSDRFSIIDKHKK